MFITTKDNSSYLNYQLTTEDLISFGFHFGLGRTLKVHFCKTLYKNVVRKYPNLDPDQYLMGICNQKPCKVSATYEPNLDQEEEKGILSFPVLARTYTLHCYLIVIEYYLLTNRSNNYPLDPRQPA